MRVRNWKKFQHFKDRKPPWVKLHRGILDDHDWHQLDGESAKTLVMLWLLASETGDGSLPSIEQIAFRLRIPEKSAKSIVSKLSHWLEQDDIALSSERYQLGPSEREIETEKETETEGDGRRKRRTPIPPDFQLTEEMRVYALGKLPDMDTTATFADFKDHHTNKGTLGLDWQAGWRTWVNNCAKGFKYAKARRREQTITGSRKVSPFDAGYRKPDGPGPVQPGVVEGEEGTDRPLDPPQRQAHAGGG